MSVPPPDPLTPRAPGTPTPQAARPPLSPRRRRLRWTLALLAGVAVLGLLAGLAVSRARRPKLYRPDERSQDITSNLAQDLPPEAPRLVFSNVTQAAGLGAFLNFTGPRTSQLPEDMGPGAAWGDYDNDGDDDLFLVSAGGALDTPAAQLAPCVLYENLGDGRFRPVAGFPETRIHGLGAAWGDYDGDGFLDLVVTGYNALLLFHNDGGTGRFTRSDALPNLKGFWSSATWGDYDHDRRLDLYVCAYVQYLENEADRGKISQQISTAVPYTLNPASYEPALNRLFHNNADGTFTEVAERLGVTNPTGRSLGALWHDFDDDGWLDLYVANDVSDNVFYHNTHGAFEDLSHPAWVADYRSAMGLAAGDYDRDGDDDLYIGHWVAQENALYDNLLVDLARGPANRTNQPALPPAANSPAPARPPPLRFMDVADQRGLGQISLPVVSWGVEFADFDADGWLDLVVANGSTLELEGPPPKRLKPEPSFLFWNQQGRFFHNLAPRCPSLAEEHVSRGLAVSDYDNDGDLDLLICDLGEGVRLLRNQTQQGHWLEVRLRSLNAAGRPLGFGDGAKVIAHVGQTQLRRTVTSVSYLSQSSHTLHFGLGAAQTVDRLEVRWQAGGTNDYTALAADQIYEVVEGESQAKPLASGGVRFANHTPAGAASGGSAAPPNDRARLLEFWNRQRAAMNAMKVEQNLPKASELFRAALELDPAHEDSRYYLGTCLAAQGDWSGALAQLAELTRLNPQSHRGHAQWGTLRALAATNDVHLAEAEQALERAHALNPEETGALLVLGEVSLLRGDLRQADDRLAAACRTNPKAVAGFFLRGYLAWKRGDAPGAEEWLKRTREALGKDWQPKGATSEGDVLKKQHVEKTPLSRFWETWDGAPQPDRAYAALEAFLAARR